MENKDENAYISDSFYLYIISVCLCFFHLCLYCTERFKHDVLYIFGLLTLVIIQYICLQSMLKIIFIHSSAFPESPLYTVYMWFRGRTEEKSSWGSVLSLPVRWVTYWVDTFRSGSISGFFSNKRLPSWHIIFAARVSFVFVHDKRLHNIISWIPSSERLPQQNES